MSGTVPLHFNYHAVSGNRAALWAFRREASRAWLWTLRRRSQKKGRHRRWGGIQRLVQTWLPIPRILHPYPNVRFHAKHPRQEPYELKARVRIRPGGGP